MNIQFLNRLAGSEQDARRAYLGMMYYYISVNGIHSTKGIKPWEALYLVGYVLSNWTIGNNEIEQEMNREVLLRNAAELERINYPDSHFFRALYSNQKGEITPYEVHLTSFLNVPTMNKLDALGGDGSNPYGFSWGSVFDFAENTMNIISKWGKSDMPEFPDPPAQTAPAQPEIIYIPQQQTQGLGTGTITLLVLTSVIVTGAIVYLSTSKKEAVSGINKDEKLKIKNRIEQIQLQ